MQIVLYSTHCPKCKVLEKKLNSKNIFFEIVTDMDVMNKMGFLSIPKLKVDDIVMNFNEANKWINDQEVCC